MRYPDNVNPVLLKTVIIRHKRLKVIRLFIYDSCAGICLLPEGRDSVLLHSKSLRQLTQYLEHSPRQPTHSGVLPAWSPGMCSDDL